MNTSVNHLPETRLKAPVSTPLLSAPPTLAPRFLEPAGLRWGRFQTTDGTSLRWAQLVAIPCKINCILLVGFTEFIEKYFETMRDLAALGYSVTCLDWRDQGGSERARGEGRGHTSHKPQPRDFHRDAIDLIAFCESLLPRTPSPAPPRLLIAHSMGAAIALLALQRSPALAEAAVFSAPMLEMETGMLPLMAARALAWLMTILGGGSLFVPGGGPWRFDPHLSANTSITSGDPERCLVHQCWFEARPRLRTDGPTFAWARAAFAVTKRLRAPGFLESMRIPILVGSAGQESFVSPRSHRRAAKIFPACRLVEFPQAKHELFMESDGVRARWFKEIETFVAGSLAVPGRPPES